MGFEEGFMGLYITGIIALVIFGLVILRLLMKHLCDYEPTSFNELMNGALYDRQDLNTSDELKNQQGLEDRRFLILTSLVHKKAISKKCRDGNKLMLPHEASLSVRSKRLNSLDDEETGRSSSAFNEKEQPSIVANALKKNDVFVESLGGDSSRRSFLDGHEDGDSTESTIYSPKKCSICLERYAPNDEICWSNNPNCYHAFHLECLADWLMRSDECPLCREDYLYSHEGDSESETHEQREGAIQHVGAA
eukprot:16578_1